MAEDVVPRRHPAQGVEVPHDQVRPDALGLQVNQPLVGGDDKGGPPRGEPDLPRRAGPHDITDWLHKNRSFHRPASGARAYCAFWVRNTSDNAKNIKKIKIFSYIFWKNVL